MPAATVAPTVPVSLPVAADVEPVSRSDPDPDAKEAFAKCQIGEGLPVTMEMVSGMGRVASGPAVLRFIPLTGREPELSTSDPVWVVQVRGDVLQMGGEVWTNPTCIVTSERSGYYATGPVRNLKTGETLLPEQPAKPPDLSLPPLAP